MVRQQPRFLGMLGRRRVASLVVAFAAAGLVSSCGGGGASSPASSKATTTAASKTTTTAKATTTEPATTTTTEPKDKPSPQTNSATMSPADLGGTWKKFEGKPVGSATGGKACGAPGEDAADKTIKARTLGDILQRGKQTQYVSTSTYQFASPADADAFVKVQLSDEWIECFRAGSEKSWKKADGPNHKVETYGVERRTDTGIFRGQYSVEYTEQEDGGTKYSDATAANIVYRKGSMVIISFLQQVPAQGDPKDFSSTVYREASAAMDKVLSRVAG